MSKFNVPNQSVDPATPAADRVVIYAKDKRLHTIDEDGVITSVTSDPFAIHDNIDGEIDAITIKPTPALVDQILIESTANAFAKRKITIQSIIDQSFDSDAVHLTVGGEINAITDLASPNVADVVLVEDSLAAYAKKKVSLTNFLQTSFTPGQVEVFSLANLPAPSGGTIKLVSFVVYIIHQPIALGTDRLIGNNITIRGNGSFLAAITSTTAGAALSTDADGLVIINGVALQNPVGTVLNIALAAGPFSVFSASQSFFTGLGTGGIGTINGAARVTASTSFFNDNITGLILNGTISTITMSNVLFTSVSGALAYKGLEIVAGAVINTALLTVCQFVTTNIADSGLSISTSATFTDAVRMTSSEHTGPGDFIDPLGVQKTDANLITFASPGVNDSIFHGSMAVPANAIVTTFATIGVEVPIGNGSPSHAIYVLGNAVERFVIVDGGVAEAQNQELEYGGKNSREFEIDVDAEIDKGGGGALDIELCVYLNSVMVADSAQISNVTNSATLGRCSTAVTVNPGDKISVCVANNTSTASITMHFVKIRIRRLL